MAKLLLPGLFAGVHAHGYLSIPMQAGRKNCPGSKHPKAKDCTLTDGNDRSWFTDKTHCKSDVNITEDDWIEVDHGDGDIVHNLKNGPGVSSCPGTAPINSPCGWHKIGHDCGGVVPGEAHTDAKHFDGCDGRAKLNAFGGSAEVTKWQAGSVQTVAWSVATPHGGLESYALCPVDQVGKDYHRDGATQACFNAGRLEFANDKTCAWTAPGKEWSGKGCYESKSHGKYWQETWPKGWQHDKEKYSTMGVKSEVKVPSTLPSGRYVLQWEWDTDGHQIWQSCADIEITGGGPAPTPEPTPRPTPQPTPTPPAPMPSPSSSCEHYEVQKDMSSKVKGFKTVKASDLDDCCSACTAEGKCTHWAFAPEDNKCFLKSGSPKAYGNKGHSLGIKQEELITV